MSKTDKVFRWLLVVALTSPAWLYVLDAYSEHHWIPVLEPIADAARRMLGL